MYKTCTHYCQPLPEFSVSGRKSAGKDVLFVVGLPRWGMKNCSFATSEHRRDNDRVCEMVLGFNFRRLVFFSCISGPIAFLSQKETRGRPNEFKSNTTRYVL